MHVQPYLNFNGRCEEALEFYRKALGANITALIRYNQSPDPSMIPPGAADKVMHASFRIGQTELMASDGCGEKSGFQGIALSLTVGDDPEADRAFAALGDGGQVRMPLTKTFFASKFGMATDRFGVPWMILSPAADKAVRSSGSK